MNSRSDKPPGTADLAVMTTITALQLKTVMGKRVYLPPFQEAAIIVLKGYLVQEMKTIEDERMKPTGGNLSENEAQTINNTKWSIQK